MIVALCLNVVVAAAICWLTYALWQWRQHLVLFNQILNQASQQLFLSPQTTSYHLTLKRAQIAEARLSAAQIQVRSRQLVQIIKLIRMLQTIFLYRKRRYSRKK